MRKVLVLIAAFLLFGVFGVEAKGKRVDDVERGYQTFVPQLSQFGMKAGSQDESRVYADYYPNGSTVHLHIRWDKAEGERGKYVVDSALKKEVDRHKAKGDWIIIGTRTSPKWARVYPEKMCSQPKAGFYDEYGGFLQWVIETYKPDAVEVWNEPDAKPADVLNEYWQFGCWDSGGRYAEMLKVVYPMIRGRVVVIAGALAYLDGGKWANEFLAGDVENFDWLSFHAYPYWGMGQEDLAWEKLEKLWARTQKPMFLSETSLLDSTLKCGSVFQGEKAKYVRHVGENAYGWGLVGWTWYSIGGNNWKCSDLHPGEAYEVWKGLVR